ncbi:MAG: DUF2752 domain-containing protein [Ignavibacteria bacterium]
MDAGKFLENKRVRATAVISAAVFFIAVLYFWNPSTDRYYPQCLFYTVTGYYCPGCGGLRGTHELLHLEFFQAFHFNPFVFVTTPLIFYSALYYAYFLLTGRDLPAVPYNKYVITTAAILTLAFWVARNVFVYFAL